MTDPQLRRCDHPECDKEAYDTTKDPTREHGYSYYCEQHREEREVTFRPGSVSHRGATVPSVGDLRHCPLPEPPRIEHNVTCNLCKQNLATYNRKDGTFSPCTECLKPPEDFMVIKSSWEETKENPKERQMFQPTIDTLGGAPAVKHDMPCSVCWKRPAVMDMERGIFEPCWGCQEQGWKTIRKKKGWFRKLLWGRHGEGWMMAKKFFKTCFRANR